MAQTNLPRQFALPLDADLLRLLDSGFVSERSSARASSPGHYHFPQAQPGLDSDQTLKPDGNRKWWHVPDDAIEAMVREMERVENEPQHSECAEPSAERPDRSSAPVRQPTRSNSCSESLCRSVSSSSVGPRSTGRIDVKVVVHSEHPQTLTIRISPDEAISPVPGERGSSLQERIERSTDIEPSRQRLFHQGQELVLHGHTLRSLNITHGQVLQLVCCKDLPVSLGSRPVLGGSCLALQRPTSSHGRRPRPGLPPEMPKPKPKWITQEHPRYFAPVGCGVDGHGGKFVAAEPFCNKRIYLGDGGNAAMERVRSLPSYSGVARGRRGGA